MELDINLLRTINNYSTLHGFSRQHVYRLAESNDITLVKIDGISFIYMDEKTQSFSRKRKEKTKKTKI